VEDGLYHVVSRGNRKRAIFREDLDRIRFLEFFGEAATRCGWHTQAYCLMPNHYHLVLETPKRTLSTGMQRLNGRYAQRFNRRYELSGHLFQGRFYAVLIESDWHLLELSRYLMLNPVRAGYCAGPADWPWSSYSATLGRAAVPSFLALDRLLPHFGRDSRNARATFRAFVEDGIRAVDSLSA
jgi:putative transposase